MPCFGVGRSTVTTRQQHSQEQHLYACEGVRMPDTHGITLSSRVMHHGAGYRETSSYNTLLPHSYSAPVSHAA